MKGKLDPRKREKLEDVYELRRKSKTIEDTLQRLNQERVERGIEPYSDKPGMEELYE